MSGLNDLTPEHITAIATAVQTCGSTKLALDYLRIDRRRFAQWMKLAKESYRDFRDDIYSQLLIELRRARAAFVINATANIVEKSEKDWRAALGLMQHRAVKYYNKKVSKREGVKVPITIIEGVNETALS